MRNTLSAVFLLHIAITIANDEQQTHYTLKARIVAKFHNRINFVTSFTIHDLIAALRYHPYAQNFVSSYK